MSSTLTTKSEELEQVEDSENIPVGEQVTDQQLVCGFLQVIQGSPTYVLVEAKRLGNFTWVFSKNGKVTSMQGIQIFAGQRAEAIARPGHVVGINCG